MNLDSPRIFMVKVQFKIVKFRILCIELIELRVVHVDRGTEHMLCWGQRIATRTGPSSTEREQGVVVECAHSLSFL